MTIIYMENETTFSDGNHQIGGKTMGSCYILNFLCGKWLDGFCQGGFFLDLLLEHRAKDLYLRREVAVSLSWSRNFNYYHLFRQMLRNSIWEILRADITCLHFLLFPLGRPNTTFLFSFHGLAASLQCQRQYQTKLRVIINIIEISATDSSARRTLTRPRHSLMKTFKEDCWKQMVVFFKEGII